MAKQVILDLLENTIGRYVLNLDASALNVSFSLNYGLKYCFGICSFVLKLHLMFFLRSRYGKAI